MNKLKTTTTALILTTGLLALPASANDMMFPTDVANELTDTLVEQVIAVSEELANELEVSISESAEALWVDMTTQAEHEATEGQE